MLSIIICDTLLITIYPCQGAKFISNSVSKSWNIMKVVLTVIFVLLIDWSICQHPSQHNGNYYYYYKLYSIFNMIYRVYFICSKM
jgi:hypothetical protein